ncbi:MAG: TY-Chap domain-containing protein, partial [Nocardioidaceae bacterium]
MVGAVGWDFESSVERAWQRFPSRLADRLAELAVGELLVLDASTAGENGGLPFVAFLGEGAGRFEAERCRATPTCMRVTPSMPTGTPRSRSGAGVAGRPSRCIGTGVLLVRVVAGAVEPGDAHVASCHLRSSPSWG